jgi:hypothetical protein
VRRLPEGVLYLVVALVAALIGLGVFLILVGGGGVDDA